MGSICVVFIQSLFEFEAHGTDRVCKQVTSIIEFLLECPVSAFNAAIVCWSARRQDVKWNRQFLAGRLELCHEFRTAIDLKRQDFKGRFFDEFDQEAFGRGCFGVGVDLGMDKLRFTLPGLKMFAGDTISAHRHMINLHAFSQRHFLVILISPRLCMRFIEVSLLPGARS